MLAVLSNPVGATIAKAAGRGTIDNTDPMPQAWLGRFGRAASDHVVEAISDRWRDGERETPQTHFRLGGREVDKLFGGRTAPAACSNLPGPDKATRRSNTKALGRAWTGSRPKPWALRAAALQAATRSEAA